MARKPNADYRPLMIEAAVQRILRGEEITIGDIAREFEVSKPLVHFYFGSHEALVDAAWESLLTTFIDNDIADVERLGHAVGWDGWFELVAMVFAKDRDAVHRAHVRAAAKAQSGGPLRDRLAASGAGTVAGWRELIEQFSELEVVSTPIDPEALALLIAAAPMGVTVISPDLTDDQRAKVAHAWAVMLRAVLDPEFDAHGQGNEALD